jgi:LmbE family N-acetylglucosaminyl deacetylase
MNRLIAFSPHYDDAVLSAGQLLIGHHSPWVVTVCTDSPLPDSELTEYDANCGFTDPADVMPARHQENLKACEIVGAQEFSLGLLDNAYGGSPQQDHDTVLHEFFRVWKLDPDDVIVGPLATKHPDHVKVMNACLQTSKRFGCNLWLYEELPHRVLWPELVTEALIDVRARHAVRLEKEFIGDGMIELKQAAVACYKSQLWSLDQRCIFVPERFHKVVRVRA